MALDDILAAIEQETASQLDAIRVEAEAQEAEVRRRAETRAGTERAQWAASRDQALAQARAQRLAAALATADRTLRAARERVFAAALEHTRARLEVLRDDERYPDLVQALLDEARATLPTATRCRVDPRDAELVARLAPDIEVHGQGTGWSGVVLEDDHDRRVDNALHTRLAVALPELRSLAATNLPMLWSES